MLISKIILSSSRCRLCRKVISIFSSMRVSGLAGRTCCA